jgi:hypothetical protein
MANPIPKEFIPACGLELLEGTVIAINDEKHVVLTAIDASDPQGRPCVIDLGKDKATLMKLSMYLDHLIQAPEHHNHIEPIEHFKDVEVDADPIDIHGEVPHVH